MLNVRAVLSYALWLVVAAGCVFLYMYYDNNMIIKIDNFYTAPFSNSLKI